MKGPIKAVIVGAGNRAEVYANLSLEKPDKLKIVGIVEPDDVRMDLVKKKFGVPDGNCFKTVEEFVSRDKFADAVINGTMDQIHVKTAIPTLKKGYDLLLEKPFAVNKEEMNELVKVANECKRKVYICHVLRYTPFYTAIKKRLLDGEIGEIKSIEMCEHVNYHHMAASYVRGKWRSEKVCFAPMLLAKSCHDIDLMMWMMNKTKPESVVSFGNDFQFGAVHKPDGAGSRCMVDCKYKDECIFSAYLDYIVRPKRWWQYVWRCLEGEGGADAPIERKIESLETDNPYGKCVWDFDRGGNVDHQSVMINFANGATGMFNMVGGSSKSERNIHIIGTKGEIKGTFEDSKYVVRKPVPEDKDGYEEKLYDLKITGDMIGANGAHGGGDIRLSEDFVDSLLGKEPSISCTDINDSTLSHLVVFKAEESRKNGTIEKIEF